MIEVFESVDKLGDTYRQYMVYQDGEHLISIRYNGEISEYQLFAHYRMKEVCLTGMYKLSDVPDHLKAFLI